MAAAKPAKAATSTCMVGAAHIDVDLSPYLPMHDQGSQAGGIGYEHSENDYTAQKDDGKMRFGLVLIDFNGNKYAIIDCYHVNPPSGFIDSV